MIHTHNKMMKLQIGFFHIVVSGLLYFVPTYVVGISVVQSEIARQRHIMPTKLFHVSQFLCQSKEWTF